MEKQGYFYIIPAKLVEEGDHIKALLYGLIYSLINEEGFCFASNAYLTKKLGRKDQSIVTTKISELVKEGWIRSEVDQASGNKRKIFLTIADPIRKLPDTYAEITDTPIRKKPTHSNTNLVKQDSNIETALAVSENKAFAEVMDKFKAVNPTHYKLFGNKTQRKALQNLIDKFGIEKVGNMIDALPGIIGQPFAPAITTPLQLETDLGKLIAFIKKQKDKQPKFVTL